MRTKLTQKTNITGTQHTPLQIYGFKCEQIIFICHYAHAL